MRLSQPAYPLIPNQHDRPLFTYQYSANASDAVQSTEILTMSIILKQSTENSLCRATIVASRHLITAGKVEESCCSAVFAATYAIAIHN